MVETNMADKKSSNGTFVAPYYTVAENSDSYAAIHSIFNTLKWSSKTPKPKRADESYGKGLTPSVASSKLSVMTLMALST
jgi:hypothetical protein